MLYAPKTPWWLKKLYPHLTWSLPPGDEKNLYLTFDDGPTEHITHFILDELKKYNAKASFFCIGKNVQEHPAIYQSILAEGHATGNHTHHHLNGWKTTDQAYVADIAEAATLIHSQLFRPPYGRIRRSEARELLHPAAGSPFSIIMWDVLSGDFDTSLEPGKCLRNVLTHAKPGSIIVFHDSLKAWDRMSFALPRVLEHFSSKGFNFRCLPQSPFPANFAG
jgi:peptidoglycan/xylan/chitin deacetylase (PgdA/CDA1 family)